MGHEHDKDAIKAAKLARRRELRRARGVSSATPFQIEDKGIEESWGPISAPFKDPAPYQIDYYRPRTAMDLALQKASEKRRLEKEDRVREARAARFAAEILAARETPPNLKLLGFLLKQSGGDALKQELRSRFPIED